MELDYNEIVKDYDVSDLTLRKVTIKYVKENFEEEIHDLRLVMTMGDGNASNNTPEETVSSSGEFKEQIINEKSIDIQKMFMGQEMTTSAWIGYIQSLVHGEFIKTVRNPHGTFLVSYDKTKEVDELMAQIPDVPEKEIIDGIKTALKEKIKNS